MNVPLLDLTEQYRRLREALRPRLDRLLDSQQFVLGPAVEEFEEQIAAYCGAARAVGVASGSDALLLALMAAGVGPGHEVVTTPYTFFATASAVVRLGARPVFADIDARTYNIDPDAAARRITPRTRALVPVHLFGRPAAMEPLLSAAAERGVAVIEDAAQAVGAEYRGRRCGSLGDAGCLSFFPTKNLGGFGDGGMVVTSREDWARAVRVLRVHGMDPKYVHKVVGINSRLDALQAVVLSEKLKHLESWQRARRANAERYARLFTQSGLVERGLVVLPAAEDAGDRQVFHQYVIRAADRDGLRRALAEQGVGTEVYYPVPLHLQECFAFLGYGPGDFPEAERAARETLALPVYPELTAEMQEYVVERIAAYYRGRP